MITNPNTTRRKQVEMAQRAAQARNRLIDQEVSERILRREQFRKLIERVNAK